jgi:hypothetical protein
MVGARLMTLIESSVPTVGWRGVPDPLMVGDAEEPPVVMVEKFPREPSGNEIV